MKQQILFFVFLIFSGNEAAENQSFPKGFLLGAASASYQVEGGWLTDGKGPNIWDWRTHTFPDDFEANGDIACDSYHKWQEDIECLKYINADVYRFSISWSRILPYGFTNKINQAGVDYYRNIINALKNNSIEPLITMYHWDNPLVLEEIGGWHNERSVEWYGDYARLLFTLYGDDVKYWLTFNEPHVFCTESYTGHTIPKYNVEGTSYYICAHNVLKAHARAYHIYHDELNQTGNIGIVLNSDGGFAGSDAPENQEALERWMQFNVGLFANPIFNGNYPQVVIDRVGNRSKLENFPRSRLPAFTKEEIDYINGTADFVGFNTYTSDIIIYSSDEPIDAEPTFNKDVGVQTYTDPSWDYSDWVHVVPEGIRMIINFFKDHYNNPKIFVTENGILDQNATLEDDFRSLYYKKYLSAVLDAIYEDKANVIGYTAWSLLDSYEWGSYGTKFGLFHIDYSTNNRTRTPKKSAGYIRTVYKNRCLIDKCVD